MKLPKKITPCPILESIIEIRFEPCIPRDAVFGVVYNEVSKKYTGEFERLPILQLPEQIRISDPNFQFSPEYRMSLNNLSFSIGPQVLSISCVAPYIGWTDFSAHISELLALFNKSSVVKKVHRFGFRCINFFDTNILNNINLNISMNNEKLVDNSSYVRTTIFSEPFINIIQIANQANANKDGINIIGSIIDIDTALEGDFINIDNISSTLLDEAHIEEKKVFYGLLNNDFLQSLNPEY